MKRLKLVVTSIRFGVESGRVKNNSDSDHLCFKPFAFVL